MKSPIYSLKIVVRINKTSQILVLVIMLSIFLGFGFLFAAEKKVSAANKNIGSQSSEKTTVSDKIIGSTFKGLARALLSTANIDKLKKDNIEKLRKKDEAKFRKEYTKIYRVIKECPAIEKRYGFKENLTKEEVVEKIEGLKKDDMYEALNLIPDSVIANQFSLYLQEKRQEIAGSNVVEQIKQLWEKMTASAFGSPKKQK